MSDCHECKKKVHRLPKVRELPLYDNIDDHYTVVYDKDRELPFASKISSLRQQFFFYSSYLGVARERTYQIYQTGLAHSQSSLDFITNEENKASRGLVIASGGLIGLFLARKGGVFKKLSYGFVGTGLVFSALYPSIAKENFNTGFEFIKYHTATALEKYGGYDAQKLTEEANSKIVSLQKVMQLGGLTEKLSEWFYRNKNKSPKSEDDIKNNDS